MITGFSSERTAEYIILHDLYEKIREQSSIFYPFFYQKYRDNTKISMKNKIEGMHFIVCFARRPKTDIPHSNYCAITFRSLIFEHVSYFSKLGISSIVGAPIGTSIEDIGFGSKCHWFQLHPRKEENYVTYEFIDGNFCSNQTDDIVCLDDRSLRNILKKAHKYNWHEILAIVDEWNFYFKTTRRTGIFNTIPGQKPVFIAYKIED